MGKIKKYRAKPKPKPVINYPPVPTKKWIPPDKRKKSPKPEPKYIKPEGLTQKLVTSTLKKVWHKYEIYGEAAIITGHFSQFCKRFSFKSNGLQGACNSAIACIYSQLYEMAFWDGDLLDEILLKGNDLYIRSTQQGDRCLIEVTPEKMHTWFFLGNQKIRLFVSPNEKMTVELTSASDQKAKEIIKQNLETFFDAHRSGIFYIKEKYVAIWVTDGKYYFFDPEEHDYRGNPWKGVPGSGVSFLGCFKALHSLVDYLFMNFPLAKEPYSKFHIIPCGIARITTVNTIPPETFDDLKPQDIVFTRIIEEPPPLPDTKQKLLEEYVQEDKIPGEPLQLEIEEMSPDVSESLPQSRRPSSFPEGTTLAKYDVCRFPVPIPTYLKGEHARLTYYTELVQDQIGILRATSCQTDPNFSKYKGRQSLGNALSALMMLRLCKAKHWVPKTIDMVLKYGDLLFRDAMLNIPRTHSLRLSDFPEKVQYEGNTFTSEIDEYALIGQLENQEFDILDLKSALEEFLADYDCCIILGPQTLAIWVEDDRYYMFDPNERDQEGKAIIKKTDFDQSTQGVACVTWHQDLKNLVNLYIANTEKTRRGERFYLSRVVIKDYLPVSEDWFNFKGIDINVWILRGSFSQASRRFPDETRNTQGTSNALIALAMSSLFQEEEWSNDTVDEILIIGNTFYQDSVEYLKNKGTYFNSHLMLSELNRSHRIRDKEADFEVGECLFNGLINAGDDLKQSLNDFFIDNDTGVLVTRDISLAIWQKNSAFYCLDPYNRDQKGIATDYGTSCTLRFLCIEDMVKTIEANLDPNVENFFNINKVKVTLYEIGEEGMKKPALNNYTKINDNSAILRGWLSEMSPKYQIRRGRQTVPMCMMAISINKLKPSNEWTKNDMDIILDKGDVLFMESMGEVQKNLESKVVEVNSDEPQVNPQGGGDAPPVLRAPASKTPEEDKKIDDIIIEEDEEEEPSEVEIKITSENVKSQLNIGPNNIELEFSTMAEGNIKEFLKDSLKSFFENETNNDGLLETKHYTVALWRDDKAYFVFDPMPRDKNGQVIGKDDWDPEPEEKLVEEDLEDEPTAVITENGEEGSEEDDEIMPPSLVDEEFEEEAIEEEENETVQEEELDDEEDEINIEDEFVKPKMSPSYWLEQENLGRACAIWFTNMEDVVDFLYENIPVKDRLRTDFTLKSVNVKNNLKVKSKYNKENERPNAYAGDWYDFVELEYGKWILRGSLDISHQLFPESNRGRQGLTCSIMALAIAHIFEMTCMLRCVPDTIIVYGDKLFTFIKRLKKKQLLSDPNTNLKEDEIDWVVQHEDFTIRDMPKKICVAQFLVDVSINPNFVTGDIKAQNFEEILDVERGLKRLFEEAKYGVMEAKGISVAVWKGHKMYYMFDGMKRGPNGVQSTIGTGCLTRYLQIEKLVEVFLQNLPILGKNDFVIHWVGLSRNLCPRERAPKQVIPAPKAVSKSAGLKLILPGKSIIRGTINQEDPRFGKGFNTLSAPIAIVALTMSLIHKPENWSRPVIDEIVTLGAELYENSVNELGFDFNPWEDKLDIYRVKRDFKLGIVKANCEIRHMDQRGYIDVKDAEMQNLRQGMEMFLEENTHGILITESLTVAIWEQKQDDGPPLIYMFDPNPRSSTGMPIFSGTACALAFANAKMATDHIIGCILDPNLRVGEFIIVPVEIVVASAKKIIRLPVEKSPTKSSINVLPRCSKQTANEEKKQLRKLAEEDRKRKQMKKLEMIGRNGYHLKGTEAILRGYKSQNSEYYDLATRNKQDIPNCIASIVMHSVLSIEDWNYRHIDLILDTGNQLYIDSYIAYGPKDPQLGMENILRKFFMESLEVHVTIYKPVVTEIFSVSKLNMVFEAFFQQETTCILQYDRKWISLFFKSGYYYMFDPHERDIEGNALKKEQKKGTAVVIRFDNLNGLTLKVINNLGGNNDIEEEKFTLWIMTVESK
ncbi:hypothetical protein ABEB36_007308 [Hypothenemus hampei]|uniref:Uncharacterized protein n=1 Tax=Hypothenemus hampei TaxID=57062 RepID=A0ABD1EXI1_HYPHA